MATTCSAWARSSRCCASRRTPPTSSATKVHDNQFGLNGTDLNGRDLFYDGTGSDNCVGPNAGVQSTTPADGSTFAPCPFSGANAFNQAAQAEAFGWALAGGSAKDPAAAEKFWIRHPHAPKSGYTPLEHFKK